jgi:Uncharacterized protein, possibly involved in aromatic compounds catabolism
MTLAELIAETRRSGRCEALIAAIPYARYLDIRVRCDASLPRFRLPFRADLIGNPLLPALHGGAVAGFMENAAALHLLLTIPAVRLPKSIDFSIDYLRSAQAADLEASCEVERLGRRVAQVQIRCTQVPLPSRGAQPEPAAEAHTVAVARAHFLLGDEADAG